VKPFLLFAFILISFLWIGIFKIIAKKFQVNLNIKTVFGNPKQKYADRGVHKFSISANPLRTQLICGTEGPEA
jgi:hypothetical protein